MSANYDKARTALLMMVGASAGTAYLLSSKVVRGAIANMLTVRPVALPRAVGSTHTTAAASAPISRPSYL